MRILSALILTHCFGCIFPDDSDDEYENRKVYDFGSAKNRTKYDAAVLAIKTTDKLTCDQRYRGAFPLATVKTAEKDPRGGQPITGLIYFHTHPRTSNSNDHRSVDKIFKGPVRRDPFLRNQESKQFSPSQRNNRQYRRKLLSHSERNFRKDSAMARQKVRVAKHSRLRKEHESVVPMTDDDTEENQREQWDDWGNWSTCSMTCGSGRQVRWRHCLSENCTKGLKRAQIKTCRLKDCDSKNILHWLGIKS